MNEYIFNFRTYPKPLFSAIPIKGLVGSRSAFFFLDPVIFHTLSGVEGGGGGGAVAILNLINMKLI